MSRLSKRLYQRSLPLFLTAIITAIFIVQYIILPQSSLDFVKTELTNWGILIATCAMFVSVIILLLMHFHKVTRGIKAKERLTVLYSGTAIVSFFTYMILGSLWPGGVNSSTYTSIYVNTIAPIAIAMNALQLFYTTRAAYRAFRAYTLEAFVMFISAVLWLLRGMPVGAVLWSWLLPIADWITTAPSAAGTRGGTIAAAIGGLILAIRALIGKEPGLIEAEVT